MRAPSSHPQLGCAATHWPVRRAHRCPTSSGVRGFGKPEGRLPSSSRRGTLRVPQRPSWLVRSSCGQTRQRCARWPSSQWCTWTDPVYGSETAGVLETAFPPGWPLSCCRGSRKHRLSSQRPPGSHCSPSGDSLRVVPSLCGLSSARSARTAPDAARSAPAMAARRRPVRLALVRRPPLSVCGSRYLRSRLIPPPLLLGHPASAMPLLTTTDSPPCRFWYFYNVPRAACKRQQQG